jgi:hypothetical protein
MMSLEGVSQVSDIRKTSNQLTSKYEETCSEREPSDHHRWQPRLRDCFFAVGFELLEVVFVIVDVDSSSEENSDEESDEWKVTDDRSPTTDLLELVREGLKICVENP